MALFDRVRWLAGSVGARLQRFANTAPLIEGIGIARQAPYGEPPDRVIAIAESDEALRGRISYQAGPQHTRYSTYIATGLSPATVYSVLRDADLGIMYRWADLCEQVLERDGHLRSVDRGRRVEVSGKPFRVQPLNDTPTAQFLAKFIRAVVDQIDSFDRSVYSLLQANAVGYSLSEIVYAQSKVRFPGLDGSPVVLDGLFPRQIDWVHPKHLRFNRDTDEPLLDVGSGGMMPLPPHKFIFHPSQGDGLYERRGHMRACVWLHLFKQQCIRDWAVFGALFGIPNIIAKYPRGIVEPNEAQALYQTVLQDFGQGKPVIVPDDLTVEATPAPSGTGNAAQVQMIGWANAEISKTVQGETLTTELAQTGSYNIGEVHADTKHAIIRDDARGAASDLRSDLFRSVVELNIDGLAKSLGVPPREILASVPLCSWRIEREVSPMQRAQIITTLANAGLRIPVDQIYDEFGFDTPGTQGEVLKGEPVTVSSGGAAVGSVDAADGVEAPPKEPAPAESSKPPVKASRRKPKKTEKP